MEQEWLTCRLDTRVYLKDQATGKIIERVLDGGLVILLANNGEIPLKGVDQVLVEGDFITIQDPMVEQVEDRQQKHGLMWPLMRATFIASEVVKTLQPFLP